MKLCVIIPALNEEATLGDVIARVPRDIAGIAETVIVVVDDGSTDATAEVARAAGALVISHRANRGVGAAFQTGVEKALALGADFAVNIDADGQFRPEDIPTLLAPLLAGEADCVTASRFLDPQFVPRMSRVKFWGNWMMSRLISWLAGARYADVSCGFRAYTRDTLARLNLFGGFTYTQETFLDLSYKGVAIREVPLRIRGTREHGRSRVASNLLRYGWQAGRIIFRSFRDYRPLKVFSALAALMALVGGALGLFLLVHYLRTHSLTPHKWAGFGSAYLAGLAVLTFVSGMLADMLARIRLNQERILYLLKQRPSPPPPSGRAG